MIVLGGFLNLFDIITKYKNSDKIAIYENERELSYRQLYNGAINLSHQIIKKKREEKVAIFLHSGCDYIVALFAIFNSGCTVVPININAMQNELLWDYQVCEFSYLVTSAKYINRLPDKIKENKELYILVSDDVSLKNSYETWRGDEQDINDIALLMNTSGTTSNMKFVMLSHNNIMSCVESFADSAKYSDEMILLIKCAFSSSYGNAVLLSALFKHATVVCGDNIISQRNFLELIEKRKVTDVECISSFLHVITQNELSQKYNIKSLKCICFGGDVAYKETIIRLHQVYQDIAISQRYGMSEASPMITVFDSSISRNDKMMFDNKISSVGTAIKNVELKIDRDAYEGELLVRGPNVMVGYYNNQEETEKTIVDGWLHTGDVASIDEDGFVFIKGRKKNIIIVGGYNVLPEEVENILCSYSGVNLAFVYGGDDENNGQRIECKIEVSSEFNSTELELKKYCRSVLPTYKVPHKIQIVDSINRNHSGKIARKK